MASPCPRCLSSKTHDLRTARQIAIASSALAGFIKGASTTLTAKSLSFPAAPFTLNRISAVLMDGCIGGAMGAIAGAKLFDSIPRAANALWCQPCGHTWSITC